MAWGIVYYRRKDGTVPAADFLDACPPSVDVRFQATLTAVRDAPPPQFSGGGRWEAMHGTMSGYYEIRTRFGRDHYRLFCMLENGSPNELRRRGFTTPQIAVINGMVKPNATLFTDRDYEKHVRKLGKDHLAQLPRRIAEG
jgi:hypothetical protein